MNEIDKKEIYRIEYRDRRGPEDQGIFAKFR